MNFLYFIIIGAIAGWIAGNIMKGGGFGLLINIILGRTWRSCRRLGVRIAGTWFR